MLTVEQLIKYVDDRLTLHNLIFTLSAIIVTYCNFNIAIFASVLFIVVELFSRGLINKAVVKIYSRNRVCALNPI